MGVVSFNSVFRATLDGRLKNPIDYPSSVPPPLRTTLHPTNMEVKHVTCHDCFREGYYGHLTVGMPRMTNATPPVSTAFPAPGFAHRGGFTAGSFPWGPDSSNPPWLTRTMRMKLSINHHRSSYIHISKKSIQIHQSSIHGTLILTKYWPQYVKREAVLSIDRISKFTL